MINSNRICTCPSCSREGKSLGAINYAETQLWNKDGHVSGSGVGVGTGGVGLGMGCGSYSEQGQSGSKRALMFKEPEMTKDTEGLSIIGIGMLSWLAFKCVSWGIPLLQQSHIKIGPDLGRIQSFLQPALLVVFILFVIMGMIVYKKNNTTNYQIYTRRLNKYHQLRYCEHCHKLFDSTGRMANANWGGFYSMLDSE